jgi:hypothetical protein
LGHAAYPERHPDAGAGHWHDVYARDDAVTAKGVDSAALG